RFGGDAGQMVNHDHAFGAEVGSHRQMRRELFHGPFQNLFDCDGFKTPRQLFYFKLRKLNSCLIHFFSLSSSCKNLRATARASWRLSARITSIASDSTNARSRFLRSSKSAMRVFASARISAAISNRTPYSSPIKAATSRLTRCVSVGLPPPVETLICK